MGTDSNIEWTHHTFNAWRGCTKVSAGCTHCYAETLSKRNPAVLGIWGKSGTRSIAAESYWKQPIKWNRDAAMAGERRRVFCASLADVFEGRDSMPEASWAAVESARVRLFNLITATPNLDWLLLTKRPENIKAMLPADWGHGYFNVWIGTSVENQEQADKRILALVAIPAAVRFLSCEPLLGPVNLGLRGTVPSDIAPRYSAMNEHIHWVIAGGESGTDARPMHPDWARELRDQCNEADVAFHFKQWGEWMPLASADEADNYPTAKIYDTSGMRWVRIGKKGAGRLLDGRTWDEMPNGVERE